MRAIVLLFILIASAAAAAEYQVTVNSGLVYDYSNVFNVEAYGAVGDGVTDDSGAINAMFAAMRSNNGGTARFESKTYYIGTSSISILEADSASITGPRIIADFGGAKIRASAASTGPILHVGTDSTRTRCVDIIGGMFEYVARNWTDGNTCILLENAYECNVIRAGAQYGHAGVELRGSSASHGCAYNDVDVSVQDCLNLFMINRTDTDSWVNENIIRGRGQYSSSLDGVDCTSGFGVNIKENDDAGYFINNNKFIGLSLECGSITDKPLGCNYVGQFNTFYSPRFEGFDFPMFSIDDATSMVTIFGGYNIRDVSYVNTTYPQAVSLVNGFQWHIPGGSSTYPAIRIANRSSVNYNALEIANTTLSSTTAFVTGNGDATFRNINATGAVALDTYTHAANIDSISALNHGVVAIPANTELYRVRKIEGGVAGQLLVLVGASDTNPPTIPDTTGINLSADWISGSGDTLTLVYYGTTWYEVGRADN